MQNIAGHCLTEDKGDGIESRLPLKIFSTLEFLIKVSKYANKKFFEPQLIGGQELMWRT